MDSKFETFVPEMATRTVVSFDAMKTAVSFDRERVWELHRGVSPPSPPVVMPEGLVTLPHATAGQYKYQKLRTWTYYRRTKRR